MKDTGEIHESPEKKVIKTPEKKIDTFDDLRTSHKPDRIDTFDDIRKQGLDKSIKTFDDISGIDDGGDKAGKTEATEKPMKETPEALEQKRLSQAGKDIKNIESMKPEKWKTLDPIGKSWALRHSGEALRDAYHTPDPPLITTKMESGLLGTYSDDDYMIKLNEDGFDYQTKKKLFGDDPKEALEAFAHEFRHSYQNEQATTFDHGFKVEDPVRAREWSENRKDYIEPPSDQDWESDPEQAMKKQEAYENQPKERDARKFASKIMAELYEPDQEAQEK